MNGVVIDIETTGLSPFKAGITEIAAVKLRDGNIVEVFTTLINPQRHIPSFITRLTGISNEMVASAPTFGEVVEEFQSFVGEDQCFAHNAGFDMGFLSHYCGMHGISLVNTPVCTAKIARRMLPQLPRKRLGDVCSHFDIINSQAHRATSDALATAEVVLEFSKMVEQHQLPELCELQKIPAAKVQTMMKGD